jgi:hypothetical protein
MRVALADSRMRASQSTIGTCERIASASRTSSTECRSSPSKQLIATMNGISRCSK